jgi:putative nucleotidyltransferase with HDIG domain
MRECPDDAVQHSLEVARKCLEIASRVKIPVDKHLLARGALFHDLGKAKSHGLDHGEIGAQDGCGTWPGGSDPPDHPQTRSRAD